MILEIREDLIEYMKEKFPRMPEEKILKEIEPYKPGDVVERLNSLLGQGCTEVIGLEEGDEIRVISSIYLVRWETRVKKD